MTEKSRIIRKAEFILIVACICLLVIDTVSATPEEDRAKGADSVRQVMADPPVAPGALQPSGYAYSSPVAIAIGILLVAIVAIIAYVYRAKKLKQHP